jgi:DNA-binding winged helix-turn-helix (wHTH) protein/Tol biopolymer transport system component
MSNQARELYEFGSFRLDPEKRLLLQANEPIPLQLKAFETLLVLVRHSRQVVMKDELIKAVWPDTFVEESNLSQNISVLRKTLSTRGGHQNYIVTIPGRGYRFTEHVRMVSEPTLVVQRHSRALVAIEEQISDSSIAVQVQTQVSPLSWSRRMLMIGALLVVLGFAIFVLRPTIPPPRVTRMRQITHIGTLVHNTKLITDGPRIYFREWQDNKREVRSVSTEGGDVFPVQIPIAESDLDDISPDSSEFLAINLTDVQSVAGSSDLCPSLWRIPVPTGSPRPVGLSTHEAVWSPDGRTIAYTQASSVFQADLDGTHSRELARLPDEPYLLHWSPDGRHIRFSVGDAQRGRYDLWQADLAARTAAPLIRDAPSSARPWGGGWTPDGKYFFYTAVDEGTRNIYAIREKGDLFHRANRHPVQLTNGPFSFYLPLPSKDGKRLFVVADQFRGELVRYDPSSRQFVPYSQPISADHVTFSRDGQWMAYVDFPDGTLVRSRVDGTQRRRLTFSPMRAFSPQWSPDGSQIAFHASPEIGAYTKIYLVSANGGVPALATPPSNDRQAYPSWSSDGGSILFSSADHAGSRVELRTWNWRTKRLSSLTGTEGFRLGQISPNGRNIVAVNGATQALTLYNVASHATRTLAGLADYPRWSKDGQFVYFNTSYFDPVGKNGGVLRWNASTNIIETLAKYPDFPLTGAAGVTFSLTPDGSILLVKDVSNRDLYSLDLDLP